MATVKPRVPNPISSRDRTRRVAEGKPHHNFSACIACAACAVAVSYTHLGEACCRW